jgi:SAM-dependent methyltransferase
VDGIPIMLLEEVEQTLWVATASIAEGAGDCLESGQVSPASSAAAIHPHVQEAVAATCGNLYRPLIGRLDRYPIPELPLGPGAGEPLLDIGCNWGRWTISAARKGYAAVGIDPSLSSIRAARRVSQQLGVEATFIVADARYLPFAPATFPVVYSYSVLQHFSRENARLALAEIGRVLKSPGTSLIQMANAYGVRSFYHQTRRRYREGEDFEVRYWTPSQLTQAFDELIGPTSVRVDGYFGLGIQPGDVQILPPHYRIVVRCSELLRRLSLKARWMHTLADSLYVESTRAAV